MFSSMSVWLFVGWLVGCFVTGIKWKLLKGFQRNLMKEWGTTDSILVWIHTWGNPGFIFVWHFISFAKSFPHFPAEQSQFTYIWVQIRIADKHQGFLTLLTVGHSLSAMLQQSLLIELPRSHWVSHSGAKQTKQLQVQQFKLSPVSNHVA